MLKPKANNYSCYYWDIKDTERIYVKYCDGTADTLDEARSEVDIAFTEYGPDDKSTMEAVIFGMTPLETRAYKTDGDDV